MEKIWTQIIARMYESLLESDYSVWIKPLSGEVLSTENGLILKVKAKNSFVANYLRKHYSEMFASILANIMSLPFGVEPQVLIEVDDAIDEKKIKSIDLKNFVQSLPQATGLLATSSEQLILPNSFPINFNETKFKHSFNDFVVGSSNKLAYVAAEAMMHEKAPAEMLFLSSQSGLGKTHLLQSVGQALAEQNKKCFQRVVYLSAEQFTTQFVRASHYKNLNEFKEYFRSADVLMLEDVHFLQGKEKTQNELLSTIKALHDRGKRVILTSSFLPKEIHGLDPSLISHFQTGFIASIDKPDMETRLHILMDKAKKQSFALPLGIAEIIASNIKSDIRILEGCLQTLMLKSQLLGTPIDESLALDVIGSVVKSNPKYDFETIVGLICKCFNINEQQLQSNSRRNELVLARNAIFYLLRKHTSLTLEQIGLKFNRRHSTVIKGISSLEKAISTQSTEGKQIEFMLSKIEEQCMQN